MKKIERGIARFLEDRDLVVLREKKSGTALNVSYTVEGLKWTTNKVGKLLYFNKAYLTSGKWVGDLSPSPYVYVEKFVPQDQPSMAGQVAEYTWIKKGTHLLYGPSVSTYPTRNSMVYMTSEG